MSSSSSSSSGTGAKSPSRLPRRSSLRRAAAALAAAAAVWAPLSMAFAGGAGVWIGVYVPMLAAGAYFALGTERRLRLRNYVVGVVLAYAAVYAGFILFLFTGCESDNGHVDGWMWAV